MPGLKDGQDYPENPLIPAIPVQTLAQSKNHA
jgi:hypothetical protein